MAEQEITTEEKDDKYGGLQQQVDQEKANAEKAREAKAEAEARAKEAEDKLVTLSDDKSASDARIAKLEEQIKAISDAEDVPVKDLLDPDLVDPSVIKAVQKLASQVQTEKAAREQVENRLNDLSKKETERQQLTVREQNIEYVLSYCDDMFGAKYRNEAYEIAKKDVQEGKEKSPLDRGEGIVLLTKYYKKLKEADKSEETVTAPATDTGSGGILFDEKSPKVGSYEDVLTDMQKDTSWKGS